MTTDIEKSVVEFVSRFAGVNPDTITPRTAINRDLGIDGDDGSQFPSQFSEEFNVDMSKLEKVYFGSEGFSLNVFAWPIINILCKLGVRKEREKRDLNIEPLPVRVLIDSAKSKAWTDL